MIKKKLIAAAVVSVATIASVGVFILQSEDAKALAVMAACHTDGLAARITTYVEAGPYIVEYADGEQILLHEEGGFIPPRSGSKKFKMPRLSNTKWVYCGVNGVYMK